MHDHSIPVAAVSLVDDTDIENHWQVRIQKVRITVVLKSECSDQAG
jgi:hypothetical protein